MPSVQGFAPSPRELARSVLRRVEQGEAYSGLALASALDKSKLPPADRALATEIVYGVLRHRLRLDRALSAHAPRGLGKLSTPVMVALRVAAYQILFLRTPAHAAVDDAVRAVKALAGGHVGNFANALLRRLATEGEPPQPSTSDLFAYLEAVHSMPRWLTERLIRAVGASEAIAAAEAMNRPPPMALRVSLDRASREELMRRIRDERPEAEVEPSRFLPEGLLLRGAGAPEMLAAWKEQLFTVQDVAAQLVSRLVGIQPGERVLDACAGVGGKTTHLAQLALAAGGQAEVDAADVSVRKLDLAMDTVRRLGLEGIRIVPCDLTCAPAGALADQYDRVLLDAPCSGLGVLRRHPEGKWRRRPREIMALADLQRRLLEALAPRVKPGGVLVYSVCTLAEEEGSQQIDRFLAAHPEFSRTPPPAQPGVDFTPFLSAEGDFRSWPHLHDTDAFFAARLSRGRDPRTEPAP
ncbi:MAG: 16S rRNA (cytosine(967)-C(5))-methyltransferase RsmB [Deltaproteobacteria bacterium]|nr:16S rRNA (cytosine(967)-C(5))-methyltransferase RsmB [Deltaproteobacteria bacterium]